MWKKYLTCLVCIAFTLLQLFVACREMPNSTIEDSLGFVRSVEPVAGGNNVSIEIGDGHDVGALFTVNISGIQHNSTLLNGTKKAWCIEFDATALKREQDGAKLYSTKGQELWRPLNYFLSIKEAIKQRYPQLTWKEIQIIIWSLIEHKPFNIDHIGEYEYFDANFFRNGRYLFDVSLTKEVLSYVRTNYSRQKELTSDTYAIIIVNDGQTIIIESGESVWAFGQHSFRSQEFRNLLGIDDIGEGQWGWIYEMSGRYMITELIAGGGNDDGTMPAEEVGTIVGYLEAIERTNLLDVTYAPSPGYYLNDLHLWVGCLLENFPWVDESGNVAPGNLPYAYSIEATSYHTFTIDLTGLSCSSNIYIAAQSGELYISKEGQSPKITILDIGVFPSTSRSYISTAFAFAINDRGEIAGNQREHIFSDDNYEGLVIVDENGFIWTEANGLVRTLYNVSIPRTVSDLNDYGQIVGNHNYGASYMYYSVEMGKSGIFQIGHLLGGAFNGSDALANNDFGQIVGYMLNALGQQRAFIWDEENGVSDLGTLPGHLASAATDINNFGQVVGWSQGESSSDRRYFLWEKNTGMTDLGTEPVVSINDHGQLSSSISINNHGQTVNNDGYLYDPKYGLIYLGTLENLDDSFGCQAYDINNRSEVSGRCPKSSGLTSRTAVKWSVKF